MKLKSPIKVIIANGNKLMSIGLQTIAAGNKWNVVFETASCKALLSKLNSKTPVDVVIADTQLKDLNGFMLMKELKKKHPAVKVLFVSAHTHQYTVNYMLHCGARGFVAANADAKAIVKAVEDVHTKGYHYTKLVSKTQVKEATETALEDITKKQTYFLELCCSNLNYVEMSEKMDVSARTVDWYRDVMFARFALTSRTDIVLFALQTGLVQL